MPDTIREVIQNSDTGTVITHRMLPIVFAVIVMVAPRERSIRYTPDRQTTQTTVEVHVVLDRPLPASRRCRRPIRGTSCRWHVPKRLHGRHRSSVACGRIAPFIPDVFGAVALYLLVITVVTSYFRFEIGRRVWKPLHYANYLLFATFAVHSVLTDPTLKDVPIDPFDAEKVFVELCVLLVLIGIGYRVRGALRRPPRRTHRPKRRRGREPLPPSSVDRILRE